MTKEQQDLAWKCLPKEVREEIKKEYQRCNCGSYIEDLLEDLFGHHNLTSDTEPEEMLYAKRSKACHLYECYKPYQRTSNEVVKDILEVVFGNKCLPDKESVQVEPKFKVGDRMYIKHLNKVGTIDIVQGYNEEEDGIFYHLKVEPKGVATAREEYLEPYTEPETKEPECIHPDGDNCKWKNICDHTQCYFDPIKSETKDNMEEKNNLKELFTKENLDEIVSSMLEYTAVITQDVINEASKYKPEEERIFIKGAAWMLYHLVKNRGQRHIYIDSDMSLDEAIQHCKEVLPLAETAQCAREHVQLRDWLTELKQRRENKQ